MMTELPLFIYLFNTYLLNIYYVPGRVLGVWNKSTKMNQKKPCSHEILLGFYKEWDTTERLNTQVYLSMLSKVQHTGLQIQRETFSFMDLEPKLLA